MKRRALIEWVVVISVILIFAYTGWHKPLIVQFQRALIYTGILSPDLSSPPVATNHGIYNMAIRDEAGQIHSLEEFSSQVVFINFWATWCPPCLAEMPGINSLFNKVKDPNLQYIIVTTEEDFAKAIAFKTEEGYDFPIYQLSGSLPAIYRHNSIPRSYVVSKEGELIMEHIGLADYDSKKFREFLLAAITDQPEA